MIAPGKKVVCISEAWRPRLFKPKNMPIKNEIYTVQEIVPVFMYGPCLKLKTYNIMWAPEQEKAAEKLLARLRAEPLAKEREEFGRMLMRHIDSFTPEERKRYDELKAILHKDE